MGNHVETKKKLERNRKSQMRAISLIIVTGLLGACATNASVSEAEARINALADARAREDRYPVLGPIEQDADLKDAGFERDYAASLRSAAAVLDETRRSAGAEPGAQSVEEIVAELRAEVARLQAEARRGRAAPVDREALGFPTPPPVE